jgi:hypothetical protein
MIAIKRRSYVDHIRNNPVLGLTADKLKSMHQDFADFTSDEYNQTVPSVGWLIQCLLRLMESDGEYIKRLMQMIEGKHLSGDHSFKLTKCVMAGGSKPFAAIYLLMNEFS